MKLKNDTFLQGGVSFFGLYIMSKFIDITGQKFGRLKVIRIAGKDKHNKYKWLCACECGNTKTILGNSLRDGMTKSCGCLVEERMATMGRKSKIHGMINGAEYKSWQSMKARCLNKNNPKYKIYGGRGITICKRWLDSFEKFYADMGKRSKGKTLDRRNNNGNYCPENCRWASVKEQGRNKRNNVVMTYKGKTLCLVEWAEIIKINPITLRNRLYKGWGVEKVLFGG